MAVDGETLEQLSGDERVVLAQFCAHGDDGVSFLPGKVTASLLNKGLLCVVGTHFVPTHLGREVNERS